MADESLELKGGNVTCRFSDDLHIMELADRGSGEVYPLQRTFEPSIAAVKIDGEWESLRPVETDYAGASLTTRLTSRSASADFHAQADGAGIRFSFNSKATNGKLIQNFAWDIGIDPRGVSVIFPSRAGVLLDDEMPLGETILFDYPWRLNAQFCLIEGKRSVLRIASFEEKSPFHLIMVTRRRPDLLNISFGIEPRAPLSDTFESPTYHIDMFPTWREAVQDYKTWMERQFKPKKLTERPQWLRELKLVVMCVCGRSVYEPGVEFHNYDDAIDLVDLLARYNAPKTTLIYVPGALVRSYDGYLPEYWPQEEQGGEARFRQFLDHAHERGFKVMCETNPFALDCAHPLYERLKQHRTSDAYGTPDSRGYRDYVGGELKDFFAYIRPSCREWKEVLTERHRRLVEKFPIDMFLLDQHFLHFNDPDCDFDEAIPALYEAIAEAASPALLAGESCHERSLRTDVPFSVVHIGLYNSVLRPSWAKLHQVDMELFRDYVVFCGHEGVLPSPGHRHIPGWPSESRMPEMRMTFEDQQERHRRMKLVPTLRITPRYGDLDEETIAVIKGAADFKY